MYGWPFGKTVRYQSFYHGEESGCPFIQHLASTYYVPCIFLVTGIVSTNKTNACPCFDGFTF